MAIREANSTKAIRAPRTKKTHIYKVNIGEDVRLVRANTRASAIKHAVNPVEANVATQDELVHLLGQNVEVEDATRKEV
jgi:hypothetical protein